MAFTWDAADGVYRTAAGDVVSPAELRAAMEKLIAHAEREIAAVAERFAGGELDTLAFRVAMQAELRPLHVAAAALAHGGTEQLDAAARGWIGAQLRAQYDFLSGFTLDAAQGALSEAQTVARARQYAASAWGTFQNASRRVAGKRGVARERNVLGPVTSGHCDECPSLSARGWVKLGSLPAVGARACVSRCTCTIEFEQARVGAA